MPRLTPDHRSRRPGLAAVAAVFALLGAAPAARATPPKGAEVLALAAKGQPPARWVRANLVERAPAGVTGGGSLALRLAFSPAGVIRLDVERLGAVRTVDTTVWGGSAPGARPLAEAPAWLQLLAGRPVADVARDKHVDTKITSFAHAGPAVLWVLGAGPRDDSPQIAVDRATGRLVRVTERSGGDDGPAAGHAVTVELGWPAAAPESPFPERVTIAQDGARPVVLGLSFVSVGDPLDADLFAPLGASPSP